MLDLLGVLVMDMHKMRPRDLALAACSTLLLAVSGVLTTYLGVLLPRIGESSAEIVTVIAATALAWLAAAAILSRVLSCRWWSFAPLLLVLAGFLAVGLATHWGLGIALLCALGLLFVLGLLSAVWTNSLVKRLRRRHETS